ncbi:MAG TPA: SdrD B-like domain-containing protein [Candidatus Krumholzibacteria bacterium]
MRSIFFGLLMVLVSLAGCGDDSTAPPPARHNDGTVQGQIGDADFQFEIHAGQPGDPLFGPFLLQGRNLHYDDDAHMLVVDLTVKNLGTYSHQEPIGLTFIQLDPDEVTVANPDNDIHGDGAAIVFHFANDDGAWTPDEESLPRTVQFSVRKGVSVAFVARLDISVPGGGTIDGVVWNDANQNGKRDDNERGVPGMDVFWGDFAQEEDSTGTHQFGRAVTDRNGHYVIGPLGAGGYVVTIGPTPGFFPTTPTEIHVLLVEVDGEVSSYHNANFGGVQAVSPPPVPGEHVHVTGKFAPPDHFAYVSDEHFVCPDSVPDPLVTDPVEPDCQGGVLRGEITEVAPQRNALRVMATWVISDAQIPLQYEVGDRVDVRVHAGPGPAGWVADYIAPWNMTHDEIQGRIDGFELGPDGAYRWFVLDTWISPSNVRVGQP